MRPATRIARYLRRAALAPTTNRSLSLTPLFSEVACARREDPTVSTVFCSPPSAGVRWQDLSLLTSAPTIFKIRSQPLKNFRVCLDSRQSLHCCRRSTETHENE